MRRALDALARMDSEQLGYLAAAVWRLAASRVRHRLLSTDRLLAGPALSPARRTGLDPAKAAQAIERVAPHLPWRADCLVQAIAMATWLRRAGYDARVHLGVARDPSANLAAHAWLSLDGRVILGDVPERAARFTQIFPTGDAPT